MLYAMKEIREHGAIVLHRKGARRLGRADEYRLKMPPNVQLVAPRTAGQYGALRATGEVAGATGGVVGAVDCTPTGQCQQVISQQVMFTITATGEVTVSRRDPLAEIKAARTVRDLARWYNDEGGHEACQVNPNVRAAWRTRDAEMRGEPRFR